MHVIIIIICTWIRLWVLLGIQLWWDLLSVCAMYTQGKKKRTTYFLKVFARIL